MLKIYRPSESEIMEQAHRALRARIGAPAMGYRTPDRTAPLYDLIGPPPVSFEKPAYRTPGYALAAAVGWISEEKQRADLAAYEARRARSLQTCHRYTLYERPRSDPPKDSGAYVPELAARIEDDRNLTDGARRCARKLAELTYRGSRADRALEVTVSYLMMALGRSRRTVQRYLRLLEREGYIRADVVKGERSRLCVGLMVQLLRPLFARHHRKRWPERARNSGATRESQNQRFKDSYKEKREEISRKMWSLKCMDGVFRAFMKTTPLFDPVLAAPG